MTRLFIKFGTLLLVLTYLAGCAISPVRAKWRDRSNELLTAQEVTAQQVNADSGTKKVLYAAFALYSDSTAFQGDAILVRDTLRSLNPQMTELLLSNQFEYTDITYPFATKENINRVLTSIAGLSDQDSLVVLLLTSHGSPNKLIIKTGGGWFSEKLSSRELKGYLEKLESIPTIILISACYSGAFVPELASENRVIITAASKDRLSFGCSTRSKYTYFIEELFQNNFDASMSLSELFEQASRQVEEREKRERKSASQPQMFVGERMKTLVSIPLRELVSKIDLNPEERETHTEAAAKP